MPHIDPYNPLDLEALGGSLLRALEAQPTAGFDELQRFAGSGIYSLYYVGETHPYAEMGAFNRRHGCYLPIYVGRAKDPGAREGLNPFEPVKDSLLYDRVREHRTSIRHVERASTAHIPLTLSEFRVRTLVCLPLWVPLAEAMAMRLYRPLWNSALSGFGIHAPGRGRGEQRRSQWDQIHSGRAFASRLPMNELTVGVLTAQVHEASVLRARRAELLLEPTLIEPHSSTP